VATRGGQGEPAEGVLNEGELLGDRRGSEVLQAAQMLDASRIEFLPFEDSGMEANQANGWTAKTLDHQKLSSPTPSM